MSDSAIYFPQSRGGGERFDVGVDVGGTNLKLALLGPDGAVVAREVMRTLAHAGHKTVLGRIAEGVRRMAATAPAGAVGAVGVGVPGELEMATGVVRDLPNLPGRWLDVPVGRLLAEATGYPTYLINDARAFAVAEHGVGAARGAESALFFIVGTGIGGAVVTHGRVHFGLGGAAGELGHLIVQPDGPRCSCGNRGCVEPLASGPAIAAEAMRRVVQGFSPELAHRAGGDLGAITPKLVDEAAEEGDQEAREILEQAGSYLGLAMAGAIVALAPEVVVVGGGVARPGGVYWWAMEATARSHARVLEIERVAIRPAALGYDAGVIGAALWARMQAEERSSPTRKAL